MIYLGCFQTGTKQMIDKHEAVYVFDRISESERRLAGSEIRTFFDLIKNKPIWATAYQVAEDGDKLVKFSKPVYGMITSQREFHEFKKGSKDLCSKSVYLDARHYTDTYDEAVYLYNKLISIREEQLMQKIKENRKYYIQAENG